MSTKNVDVIMPQQSRGARALLDMTQPQLAASSGLGLSTVVDFERSRRPVSKEAIQAIRIALENAGIEFIAENGGGPGVRLRKRQRAKKPK
jgi:transcriptional regulator with XRE-family HTH domain